jgi:hypothetical protein
MPVFDDFDLSAPAPIDDYTPAVADQNRLVELATRVLDRCPAGDEDLQNALEELVGDDTDLLRALYSSWWAQRRETLRLERQVR